MTPPTSGDWQSSPMELSSSAARTAPQGAQAEVPGRRRHFSSLCLSYLRKMGMAVARRRRPRRRQHSPHPAHVCPSSRRPSSLSHRSHGSREAPPPLPKRLLRESSGHQTRLSRGPSTGEQKETEIRNRLTALTQEVGEPTPEARAASVPVASFLQASARLTGFIAGRPTSRPATVSLQPHQGLTPRRTRPSAQLIGSALCEVGRGVF